MRIIDLWFVEYDDDATFYERLHVVESKISRYKICDYNVCAELLKDHCIECSIYPNELNKENSFGMASNIPYPITNKRRRKVCVGLSYGLSLQLWHLFY